MHYLAKLSKLKLTLEGLTLIYKNLHLTRQTTIINNTKAKCFFKKEVKILK